MWIFLETGNANECDHGHSRYTSNDAIQNRIHFNNLSNLIMKILVKFAKKRNSYGTTLAIIFDYFSKNFNEGLVLHKGVPIIETALNKKPFKF